MTSHNPSDFPISTEEQNDDREAVTPETEQDELETPESGSEPPRWWILLLVVALLAGGGGYLGWQWWQSRQQTGQEQSQNQPTPVEVETVEPRTVTDSTNLVGTLEAQQTAQLRSQTSGEIVAIYVQAGDRVLAGETLAQLDNRTAQADLARAEAEVSRANARLAELQAGTRVERIAQARARLRQAEANLRNAQAGASPAEIAQAQARVESAQATVELTAQRLDRFQLLQARGAVPTDELDAVRERYRTARADLDEAQRELEALRENQDTDISRLQAQVEEDRQELRELENGARPEEIAQAQADLESALADAQAAEVRLQNTEILAPFDGTVGDLQVKVGDYLSQSDIFTTLVQNQNLELRLSVPLERTQQLRLGQPVEIFDAAGDAETPQTEDRRTRTEENRSPLATGRVNFIAPQVSGASQTVLVKATFTNPEERLRDRQFVRARLIQNLRPGSILIPTTAITFQGQRRFVFLAEGQGENLTVRRQQVELGLSNGDRTEITEGIQIGDRLITSGLQKLRDGQPIRITSD